MFRPAAIQLAQRLAEVIDEMLVGDFDFVEDESGLYADVDYERRHPHRVELRIPLERRPCNAPAPRPLTVAALRCHG